MLEDKVLKAIEGGYDCHMHARPCIQARRRTMLQLTRDYAELGMKGFAVKDHDFPTVHAAAILNELQDDVRVVGGITVSTGVGGLNPSAVETAFKLGGKVFWMASLEASWIYERMDDPSFKNAANYKSLGVSADRVSYRTTLSKDSDELLPATKEILQLCKDYNAVYETSHSSKREAMACLKEAKNMGIDKFVVTHANTDLIPYTAEEMVEMADMGAVIMLVMASYMGKPGEPCADIKELASLIKLIGAERIVLATDFGLNIWPSAAEGIRMMASNLLNMGISSEEIQVMLKDNPGKLYFD